MDIGLKFIVEQDGPIERKFKQALTQVFLNSKKLIRAYLVLAQWETNGSYQVMLCLRVPGSEDLALLDKCGEVFKSLFSADTHLDMLFITGKQEIELRKLCCPFYTTKGYIVPTPDFYLFSHEGYHLDDEPRACFMRKRLYGDRRDGFMLCDISPPLIGQPYELGDQDIHQVVFANRLQGDSLFPISTWPIEVYVTRLLNDKAILGDTLVESDHELIAWASLYKHKDDIKL